MLDFPEQYGDEDQIQGSSSPAGGASWDATAFSVPQRPQSAPLSDHRSLLGQPSGHVGDGMMWSVAGMIRARCLKYIGILCTYALSIVWSEAFGRLGAI